MRDSLENIYEEIFKMFSPFSLGLFFLLFLKIFEIFRAYFRLPPGPGGLLRILGMNKNFKRELHIEYFELGKTFKKIFSLYNGNQLIVVLSDPKLIKEAFMNYVYSGRPNSDFGMGEFKIFLLEW